MGKTIGISDLVIYFIICYGKKNFSKKQLEWTLEVGLFFLTPKRRVLGKNDQAQKVLKIVSLPPLKGKNFDFSKKNPIF